MDPETGQLRRQNGNGENPARRQLQDLRHDPDDLAIGEDVRPADVQPPIDGPRLVQAGDQVVQRVPHGDRLRRRRHPARRHHHREPLDEISQNLERRRARPDDHRRAQRRDRHGAPNAERLPLRTGSQVGAQAPAALAQSSQVDDPRQTRPLRGRGEAARDRPVPFRVVLACGDHGVNQVVGRPAAGHRLGDALRVLGVRLDHGETRVAGPFALGELPRIPDEAADGTSSGE